MSMDRTLKAHGGLVRGRSVLTRAERIANLTEDGKFDPENDSPFALPKVRVHHSRAGTKSKKAAAPGEEAAPVEGAAAEEAAAAKPKENAKSAEK